MEKIQIIATVVCAVFASTGFWAFLTNALQKRQTKNTAESKMLKGIGHDRICFLGGKYIARGFITKDEYENLHDYLYTPYKELGGNGTVDKVMKEINSLPLKEMK